jgi:hypothetical protein
MGVQRLTLTYALNQALAVSVTGSLWESKVRSMSLFPRGSWFNSDCKEKAATKPKSNPEDIEEEAAKFHFLGSGNPLPVDRTGKRVLRPGQQLLFVALRSSCRMPERQIVRILRHTDYVPCEILDLVAAVIEEHFSAYRQPTLTDVARRCIAAERVMRPVRAW